MHAILKKYDVPLASNQIEFSLLRQLPEKNGLLAAMKELGVACMACTLYSPRWITS
jgi:diketogulonate reductase-like aldo/keto reductase